MSTEKSSQKAVTTSTGAGKRYFSTKPMDVTTCHIIINKAIADTDHNLLVMF